MIPCRLFVVTAWDGAQRLTGGEHSELRWVPCHAMPNDALEQLADRSFSADGPITALFRAAGTHDFVGAARHLLALPYGRIADRNKFWLVLEEGRGTCTTKHALLAELAREQ